MPRRLSNLSCVAAVSLVVCLAAADNNLGQGSRSVVRVAQVAPAVPPPPPPISPSPVALSLPSDAAPRRVSAVPVGIQVVAWAMRQIGVPYLMGATGPWAYDCSGLALSAWRTAGVELPRVAADQFGAGVHVPLAQAQPGDLVFFGGWSIYHVGIYAGDMLMVDAPHSGAVVQVVPIEAVGVPLAEVTRPAA